MPKSKKPRKKGAHGREQIARRKWEAGNFKSVEDARSTFRIIDEARRRRRGGRAQIGFMLNLANKERLIEDFTSAFFALERWPTTTSYDDFNRVSSSLMLGLLCHKCLGVEEKSYVKEIQHAAFIAVVCVRLRNRRELIPQANLDIVRHGLVLAQELLEYTYEHHRTELIHVLRHNDKANVYHTAGLTEAHERFILGDRYETVKQWELEDDNLQDTYNPDPNQRLPLPKGLTQEEQNA